MGRIWTVTSGNGGVGKTTIALSLAAEAERQGKNVILLDASGDGRACDLMLGLESVISIDLTDILNQQMDIQSALYDVPDFKNLRFVSASLSESVLLDDMSGIILALQSMCDVLIIDLPTGALLNHDVLNTADEILVVARPDDVSVRASEKLIQKAKNSRASISLILNHVRRDLIKKGIQYERDPVAMTLDCPVIGTIPAEDGYVSGIVKPKATARFLSLRSNPIRDILLQLIET